MDAISSSAIGQAALLATQNATLQSSLDPADKAARRIGASQSGQNKYPEAASKAASEFESVFIGQFLGSMYQGVPTDGLTGGGQGEAMFRSLLIDQYAKSIEKQGGFGLAASVKAELLKHQQMSQQAAVQ